MPPDPNGIVVYLAGHPWDGVQGTDRHLATALSRRVPVLWIDPPAPALPALRKSLRRGNAPSTGMDIVGDNICRLRVLGPPGLTRPVARTLSGIHLRRRVLLSVRSLEVGISAVVPANPEGQFPRGILGRKFYFVTDDWPAGAAMMGLSRRRIERLTRVNVRDADIVAAVTPQLLDTVLGGAAPHPPASLLLANGCDPEPYAGRSVSRPAELPAEPFAILVGQINERIDLAMVQGVADRGVHVVVVGPRTERDASTAEQLDRLFAHPTVTWLGARRPEQLPEYLHAASVGLTPYVNNAFNRASFPLKTLEYLAAGLHVVSTDLPAARWLNTDLVTIADDQDDFARQAHCAVHRRSSEGQSERLIRQDFARAHSWDARALELLGAL